MKVENWYKPIDGKCSQTVGQKWVNSFRLIAASPAAADVGMY